MIADGRALLAEASQHDLAVGAFTVYDLEGVRAVVRAAEDAGAPVFLTVSAATLADGLAPLLVAAGRAAAEAARVAVALHVDHARDPAMVEQARALGLTSLMFDGSALPFEENVARTRAVVDAAESLPVEGELGGIAGAEEVGGGEGAAGELTDPERAVEFVARTRVASLAVAIGNVHGRYETPPELDFGLLATLHARVPVPLVLHGASGLDADVLRRCVALGIRKVNVNTELRRTYLAALAAGLPARRAAADVAGLLREAGEAMRHEIARTITLLSGR